jgi:hypothetical protein
MFPNWTIALVSCSIELVDKCFQESAGQEGILGVTFHAPRSAKECEGMNPHTPKGTPTLGVGILMDFRIFR